MKLFAGGESCWRLLISVAIILLICGQTIGSPDTTEEAVAEDEVDHHNDHHHDHGGGDDDEGEVSSSGEVSSDDHSPVVRGHGESCSDDAATCDSGAGLICVEEVGKCECDKHVGEVYSEELGKCEQHSPPDIPEVKDNSLEDGEASTSEEETRSKEEEEEDEHVQNDETSPTTTTETVVKGLDRENSLEEDNTAELTIQHRADADSDEKEDKSEETSGHAAGKCANVNCEEILGRFSKCDEETGECHCHDVEGQNRPVITKNGHCFINRYINDPCSSHDDCTATIAGRAWCHMDIVTRNRFCQCEMFHYFDDSMKECLPFASDGIASPCKTDMQCTGFQTEVTGHGLGPHARCSPEKEKCECKMRADGQKAFLYENYCFYQLLPGEHCNIDRECEVSFPGQEVACLEGKCMCKDGENITAVSCPSEEILGGSRRVDGMFDDESEEDGVIDNLKSAMGLDLPNFVFIMIIGAVVVLAVVIISVLVVKKRHKYSMVRTREPTEEPASP